MALLDFKMLLNQILLIKVLFQSFTHPQESFTAAALLIFFSFVSHFASCDAAIPSVATTLNSSELLVLVQPQTCSQSNL